MAIAGLEGRKEILRAKQDMVDAAFKQALEKVISLPDEEYCRLLEDMAVKSAVNGNGEILLSEKDMRRISSSFLGNVNKKLN
ncbi:V-type ATP synthase subunit E family protein, partial [Escherichia coli]